MAGSRAAAATANPAAAKATAMARPIPRLAPVTTATGGTGGAGRLTRPRRPQASAARSADRIRSGVIGSSVRRTPSGYSASLTAALMAAGAIIRPPSPPPLTPCGVYGNGVST